MADALNGNGKKKGLNAMGIGFAVSIIGMIMGWGLLAQSWAKDAGHQVIVQRIDSTENTDDRQDVTLNRLELAVERILANQDSFLKQLDRIERKLP